MRSFLAVLGVLVGTASVVALVSSGELATEHALAQFKALGTNLLAVSLTQEPTAKGSSQQKSELTPKDVKILAARVAGVDRAAGYTNNFPPISYDGKRINGSVIGAGRELQEIIGVDLSKGRFVSSLDGSELFCVVGANVAKTMLEKGVFNPVGKQIKVGDHYFTIVGVAKPWKENMFMYADVNESLIIPVNTSFLIDKNVQITNLIFRLNRNLNLKTVQANILGELKTMVPTMRAFARSPQQLVSSMQRQHRTFTLLLGMIGGISLLVGGIGVMNIMLVSVTERRREIGIRMAIGAKRRDIQKMFLLESVTLTLFGGLVGVIIGVLASLIITEFAHWGFHLFLLPPALGFLVSVMVGIFFGFYPALKASRLDPIETLRGE